MATRGSSRITGITIEIDGDTTKLSSALKGVDTQLKTTKSTLKDVDKLLKLDPTNTELLEQKQKNLASAINDTKKRLETLKSANKDAMSTEEYDAVQREIVETEQELKSLEAEYKNFGSVAAQKVAAVGEKMKDVGEKITNVGKSLSTYVTLPLVGVGTAGVTAFAEVDKTMQLTNKTMGNTEEEAKLLGQAMKDAAANSTFGMSDAATATLNFARAGLDAEEAAAALAPAMNLAAGEGGNLDTVSAGLVATINGFHGSFEDASTYADVFAAACNNSALDVDSLSNAMSVAAPIFASAGYSVNDAALYMGVMANNGIEAEKAANSLKTGIARLVSPAKEGAEAMEALGISVTNSDGTMKDSVTIQAELHDAFSQLSESEQLAAASAIFGKNQMAPWLALINTAPEDVGELNDSLTNCAGTTEEMAEAMMGGFGGSIEKLKSSIDVLVTTIGETLAPIIQKVIDKVQSWVDKYNSLDDESKTLITTIGLVVAAVGPVLTVIGKVTSGIGGLLTALPNIISFLSGPGGIAVAIAGVIAAGVYLVTHWEEVKEKAKEIWGKIKDFAKDCWEKIKSIEWKKLGEDVWNWITSAFLDIATWATDTFDKAVAAIKEIDWRQLGADVWDWIAGGVGTVADWFSDAFSSAWDAITAIDWGAVGTTIWNAIVATLEGFADWFIGVFKAPINAVISLINSMIGGVESAVNGVVNAINNTVRIHLDPIYVFGQKVFPGIDWGANLSKVSWGRLDYLANGGVLGNGGQAVVGEYAPEYLRVVNGQAVVTPIQGAERFNKESTINNTFNIYTQPGQSPREIAAEVQRIMTREQLQREAVYA